MKPTQTIEQAEVLLCNLLALITPPYGRFQDRTRWYSVTLQTAVNLLWMAQDALYEKSAYSLVDNITVLNEWNHDGRNTNQRWFNVYEPNQRQSPNCLPRPSSQGEDNQGKPPVPTTLTTADTGITSRFSSAGLSHIHSRHFHACKTRG